MNTTQSIFTRNQYEKKEMEKSRVEHKLKLFHLFLSCRPNTSLDGTPYCRNEHNPHSNNSNDNDDDNDNDNSIIIIVVIIIIKMMMMIKYNWE